MRWWWSLRHSRRERLGGQKQGTRHKELMLKHWGCGGGQEEGGEEQQGALQSQEGYCYEY